MSEWPSDGYAASMESLRRPSRVEPGPSLQDRVERLERALADMDRRVTPVVNALNLWMEDVTAALTEFDRRLTAQEEHVRTLAALGKQVTDAVDALAGIIDRRLKALETDGNGERG